MADRGRLKREPKHIRLYASIMASEAWQHLSGNAVKVLLALVARDDGTRNGNIGFSCREAATATNLSAHTANRCLIELEEKGFIACTQRGGFSRKVSHSSLWRYTWAAWPAGKKGPTRDFEKWKHDEKSRCGNFPATVSNFSPDVETPPDAVSNIGTEEMETSDVSDVSTQANIGTLISYQGEAHGESDFQQRKQANSSSGAISAFPWDDLADLRHLTRRHVEHASAGEQSRLAEAIGCPPGTLSKFINGRNLPAQYRPALADAIEGA